MTEKKQVAKLTAQQRKKNQIKIDQMKVGMTIYQPTTKGRIIGVIKADEDGNISIQEVDGKQAVLADIVPFGNNKRGGEILFNIARINLVLED